MIAAAKTKSKASGKRRGNIESSLQMAFELVKYNRPGYDSQPSWSLDFVDHV